MDFIFCSLSLSLSLSLPPSLSLSSIESSISFSSTNVIYKRQSDTFVANAPRTA